MVEGAVVLERWGPGKDIEVRGEEDRDFGSRILKGDGEHHAVIRSPACFSYLGSLRRSALPLAHHATDPPRADFGLGQTRPPSSPAASWDAGPVRDRRRTGRTLESDTVGASAHPPGALDITPYVGKARKRTYGDLCRLQSIFVKPSDMDDARSFEKACRR